MAGARWSHSFDDAPGPDRELLGGKGAGLVEMRALGVPVPPGFVLSTACGRAYLESGGLPDGAEDELMSRLAALEESTGRRFGDAAAPLLVSVRSGAPASMPGMLDTILNCGLTAEGARALAAESGDELFALSCLERLLMGFATTVRDVPAAVVEDVLLDLPREADAVAATQARCTALQHLIDEGPGRPFPDAQGQLLESVEAVFRSWNSRRARAYRTHKGIDDSMATAVVVQAMVFGNRGPRSASGVAFTRDPATGRPGLYGDVLFEAQGEDVVSGEHDTEELASIGDRAPDVLAELQEICERLEAHTADLCDIEFTIEDGRLWVLQTRIGQRSGRAAVRLAVDFCDEGLISRDEALGRVTDHQLRAAQAPVFSAPAADEELLASGLPASPGAVVGALAFTPARAQALRDAGTEVVLLRPTTSPADLPGLIAAVAVVTGHGGRTSHAAVVARGMERPAVCGIGDVTIGGDGRTAAINGRRVLEGELVAVDGDRGLVSLGERPIAPAHEQDPALARFLRWRRDARAARPMPTTGGDRP